MRKLIFAKNLNKTELSGLVDLSGNEMKVFCYCNFEVATEIIKIIKDNEAHENRIRVLSNLNKKYREKLGLSNETMNLDLIIDLE